MKNPTPNNYQLTQSVTVYRTDGSRWFDGMITYISEKSGRLLVMDLEGDEIPINPTINKVEII